MKHSDANSLSFRAESPQCERIESRDGGHTCAEQAIGQSVVTAITLIPTVSAKLEQLKQTPQSPIATARENLLTRVAPDPDLVDTNIMVKS